MTCTACSSKHAGTCWITRSVEPMGTLYLMPTWLGESGGPEQLPPENIVLARRIDLWFCEHERSARRALRRMDAGLDLTRIELHRFDKDSTRSEAHALIGLVAAGRDAAVISEAGIPGIADPGALLVAAAHEAGIRVMPLIGPNSLMLTLAASGLNGQHFRFHGYLPLKSDERKHAIKRIEQDALRTGAAQLLIETPYRNDALLEDLCSTCAPTTQLCIGIDVTQPDGWVRTKSIKQWRADRPALGKRPAVFVIEA